MPKAENNITIYISNTLCVEAALSEWPQSASLPFHLRNQYTFQQTKLLATPCLLVHDNSPNDQSPTVIRRHLDQIRKVCPDELIYVRDQVTAYSRKQMIKHKISFIIPGSQMYLPWLGIDLREHFRKQRALPTHFSPATQALLIWLLLRAEDGAAFAPSAMAAHLGYSGMTMTRAFDELEATGLGRFERDGRTRLVQLAAPPAELWRSALPYLRDPVRQRVLIEPLSVCPPGLKSGLSALATMTSLAAPVGPVVAVGAKEWRAFKRRVRVFEYPVPEPAAWQVEVWRYDPGLLTTGDVVDRLSLYLSLREGGDERVEQAVEEMMMGLPW